MISQHYQINSSDQDGVDFDGEIFIFDHEGLPQKFEDSENIQIAQHPSFHLTDLQRKGEQLESFEREETAVQSQNNNTTLPKLTKDSGYYYQQQKKKSKAPTKQKPPSYFNENDQDIGEVGEWVEHRANVHDDNDEFDVFDTQPQRVVSVHYVQPQLVGNIDNPEDEEQKVNKQRDLIQKKLDQKKNHKKGPIVNNLKEKAKSIALSNNKPNKQVQSQFSDNEVEEDSVEHPPHNDSSPDKKIFQIKENTLEKQLSQRSLSKQKIQSPMDEWAAINEARLKELQNSPEKPKFKQILYIEAWDLLKQNRQLRDSIKERRDNPQQSFFQKYLGCFSTHLKSSKLVDEKNFIIQLTQTSYVETSELHFRIIYTIYCQFMHTDFCQRYGNHWENIGFQGRDPATDFRGTGIMGPLQILAFLHNYNEYILDCLEYSKQPQSQLPLCVTLINLTLFCVRALQNEKFNLMINKEDSALSVINKVFFAAWYFFYERYKQDGGQFNSIGPLLNHIKNMIEKRPSQLVKDFNQAIKRYYKNKEN